MYYQPQIDFKPEEVIDYLRKSRSDDPTLSVEEVLARHEAILDEMAEKYLGGKVPEENKYREVVSGETLKERPEMQKVIRRIQSPKIKAIKIVEPQRLTRGDLEDIGRIMKLLKHTNTIVITQTKIYDLRDEYDWDAFERELKRGNEFLEYQKKIMNRGRLLSASKGNYLGSIPPYGFDKITVMDGKEKCPTLKENKEQADVVRLIFDLFVNKNMGRYRMARYLDEIGIKAPNAKHWSAASIRDMLENVHYIGKVKWNWRQTITVVEEDEFIKKRPKNKIGEYLIFEGRHEGIIAPEIFEAAQKKLGSGDRTRSDKRLQNAFAGLLYCSCGRAMSRQRLRNEEARLLCPDHGYCQTRSCKYEEIVERVSDVLEKCIEDFEVRIENNEGDSVKLHASLIQNLEKKLKDLEAREISQWELQADPDPAKRMPQEIFQRLNAKLLEDKEEIRQALCKAYESMPEPVDYTDKVITFKAALEALRDSNADAAKKNSLLKACIERIEYKRERGERIAKKKTQSQISWSHTPIELDIKLNV